MPAQEVGRIKGGGAMPPPLTPKQLTQRAQAELNKAEFAYTETLTLGRTSGRTTRLRAAKRRAGALLAQAVRRGLAEDEAREIYESAPPDPEFGEAEW